MTPAVVVAMAFGPTCQVIRPSVFGSDSFRDKLMVRAMFSRHAVLEPGERTETRLRDDTLTLAQANASISVDELATIAIRRPAVPLHSLGTLATTIDDTIRCAIERSLKLSIELLGDFDETRQLTHTVPVVALNAGTPHLVVVKLRDPAVALSSLPAQVGPIAEDLTALVARRMQC